MLEHPAVGTFDRPVPAADIADVAHRLANTHVLVTGGTGFLGGRLVERLLIECGARPRVLVRDYGRVAALARFGLDRITLVEGELGNTQSLVRAVAGCSVVFHCAMDRGNRRLNIDGIKALMAACLQQQARLVHISSLAVYEPLRDGDLDETIVPVRSGMRYSDAKLEVEELVLEAMEKDGLDATVILPTIVYGPWAKAWTTVPASQLATGTVVLPEKGEGLCNAVYVDDVCQAMIRAAGTPAARGRRYLISGPVPVTWAAFFGSIADAIGRPGPRLVPADKVMNKGMGPSRVLRSLRAATGRVAGMGRVRALAKWGKSRISASNQRRLVRLYQFYRRRSPPPVYTPNAQQTALYRSRCHVRIERAVMELGYQPAYDLARGMALTAKWLRWASLPEE